jgi:PAS domain S-box-containing protein
VGRNHGTDDGGTSSVTSRIADALSSIAIRLATESWRSETDAIFASLCASVGAKSASLFELRKSAGRWDAELVSTWPAREGAGPRPETVGELSERWVRVLTEGRALPGAAEYASWYVLRVLERSGRSGSLVVPVVAGVEPLGYITLEGSDVRRWSEPDLSLLAAIGSVIGTAIAREGADRHLRDAELRYQTLVEQIPAIAYIDRPDPDSPTRFRPVYFSPQVERILGYRPEELEGNAELWIELLHPDDRERALAADAAHHATGEPLENDYRLLARDGRIVWVRDEARMVRDEVGVPRFSHGVLLDVTEQKLAELELRGAMEALTRLDAQRRALLARLVTAQEEERMRVARGIHDESMQQLGFAVMTLDALRRRLPAERDELDRVAGSVRAAIETLRTFLFELAPPLLEADGIAAAIDAAVEHAFTGTGIQRSFRATVDVEPPQECALIAYRIVQEALTNVRKHADATNVEVELDADRDGIRVRVEDNGKGFTVPAHAREGHLGLAIMRERAELAGGWFRIGSAPDDGTSVQAWVPCGAPSEGSPTRPTQER